VRPKRPTSGKEKPGITSTEWNHRRDSEPTNCVTETSVVCVSGMWGNSQIWKGSTVMRQKECRLSGCTYADR
jgi:hypothetical protein